jgi:hypothetical protein
MCRILFGCLKNDGDIVSGSNGDDPAVDFSVEKTGDEIEIYYRTPFKDKPSVTITPNYGPIPPGGSNRRFGGVFLTSNEPSRFSLRVSSEHDAIMPVDFSFIALK